MDQNYDTFSYPEEGEQEMYEPILDSGYPTLPTRNPLLPPVPPRKVAPVTTLAKAPEMNYEELNEVQPFIVPKLPRRNSPSFREFPKRSNSPIPDVPQRVPPRIPDNPPVVVTPELNYEDPNNFETRSLPPLPVSETPQKKRTQILPVEESKRNLQETSTDSQIDTGMLNNIRKNLKKVDLRPQNETPKASYPKRLDINSESDVPIIKPFLPKKPQILSKPSQNNLSRKTSPFISERINSFNVKSTDEQDAPASLNVLSNNNEDNNNNISNNSQTENLENNSSDEYADQVEYCDAGDVESLFLQSYFYEDFDKSLENQLFNKETQDGTFIIRKSRNSNPTINNHPYTMLIYHQNRAFRLKIRCEDKKFAIGEKKDDENRFDSVIDLVDYYTEIPLMLIGAGSTTLKFPTKILKK